MQECCLGEEEKVVEAVAPIIHQAVTENISIVNNRKHRHINTVPKIIHKTDLLHLILPTMLTNILPRLHPAAPTHPPISTAIIPEIPLHKKIPVAVTEAEPKVAKNEHSESGVRIQ